MKITAVEPVVVYVNRRGDWVFLLVHTDAGITGLGEASHSGNDALLLATVRAFARQLVGQNPLAINRLWRALSRVDGGRIAHTALSGIEQALWDIVGQHLGVPVHALFGGAVRERLRLYANINRHVTDRSPAGFARAARQAVDEGFTAIKLAPFDEVRGRDHVRTGPRAAWRTGVARVEAVRAAIGDDVDLMVDCHGRMEVSEAVAVGRALADCNLMWYEEPVRHTFPDHLAEVAGRVPMPVASAESVFGVEGFRPFLLERAVDVLMPDVKHCGGIAEMVNIAQAARLRCVGQGHHAVDPAFLGEDRQPLLQLGRIQQLGRVRRQPARAVQEAVEASQRGEFPRKAPVPQRAAAFGSPTQPRQVAPQQRPVHGQGPEVPPVIQEIQVLPQVAQVALHRVGRVGLLHPQVGFVCFQERLHGEKVSEAPMARKR